MQKLDGKTFNVVMDNIDKLKELFPEVVTENKIDMDKLRIVLGEHVEKEKERYEFTWNGKTEAIQLSQKQTTGTLLPCKEESVNWETAQNLYIEGDNLEVLRLLQTSYRNKVKVIYVDPPYNTGRDFVYKDNFHDNIKSYTERLEENMKSNAETNGRYHTDWLNMMYPRLKIARSLLADDGILFISIDDHEVDNLKKLCNEIFGENNFVALLPTIMNLKGNNDQFGFSGTHEYTLVYVKNIEKIEDFYGLPLSEEDQKEYLLKDEKGFYKKGATLMRTGEAGAREKRPKGYYPVYVSSDYTRMSVEKMKTDDLVVYPKTKNGKEMSWRRSKENLANTINEFIITPTKDGVAFNKKQRLDEDMVNGKKAKTLFYKPSYSSGNGTNEIRDLLGGRYFDNPKPVELLKDFIRIAAREGIILDFFSGSATAAQATMELNAVDKGKRRFIMVQLPEMTDKSSEAYKAGYKNICDIAKERIRRAGKKIVEEHQASNGNDSLDIGFKVFKLSNTNLKEWNEESLDLEKELLDIVEPIKAGRTQEDVVYEILLKYGIDLNVPIDITNIAGKTVYSVGMGYLLICLDYELTLEQIEEMAKRNPARIVFYDEGFKDDTVRTNAQQILKRYGVDDIRVI
ncbi:site-specific DNA-methyltransferase [Neobacillus jeddahensis]|uniref:site-specific DNA-methyltransferase n=1 Tax=Neobacillus jeddahensis TaxID=1461580 RepID=UPI0005918386|nr:site-specific DNA-methyltransferase [Neobacillus jeddahensis]